MPGDIDKINEIFRIHDEAINSSEQPEKKEAEETKGKKKRSKKEALKELRSPVKAMDKLLTDVLGARRCGVLALMVEPLGGPVGAWNHVLHLLQRPFKAIAKRRYEKHEQI